MLARVIYGFRISILFGLTLSILCTPIGIFAGALQGYFGGAVDLFFQRFLEIFGSMPTLFLLMILASAVTPNFWWLLGIMVFTTWTWPVGLVRAEFLRARNFEYVRAARALGVRNTTIMCRHLLPNAMVSTLTFLPFQVGAIHHPADLAGFPRLRPAARLALAGRSAASGRDESPGALARHHGLRRARPAADLLVFVGEGGPRRLRSAQERRMSETGMGDGGALLEVRDLSVAFGRTTPKPAVDHVSFSLDKGETLAIVGESGSGKTVTALSILQLLPYPLARHPSGSIRFAGEELLGASRTRLRQIRGNRIAMVFQEPMTSLNPLHRIERQIGETLALHKHMPEAQRRRRIIELLHLVGLPEAEKRLARLSP